jgi:hypothetical protein
LDHSPFSPTVYVPGTGLLFDEIIRHMLISDSRLRVIHRVYAGESAFLTDVGLCHPDVILLNETDLLTGKRMLALLSQILLTTKLRVIVVSLDSNNVHIFDQPADPMNRQIGIPHTIKKITDWDELFDLVEESPKLDTAR